MGNPPSSVNDLDTQWIVGLNVLLTWDLFSTVNPITLRLRHWRASDVILAILLGGFPLVGQVSYIIVANNLIRFRC
jgi:hypothetical protein